MTSLTLSRRDALIGAGAGALIAAAPFGAFAQDTPFAAGEQVLGAADAPVTIVEYASLTCPHCASFHASVWPDLKAQFVDTGKVRFIMREVYFDRFGLWAAALARCGGPETYFPFIDVIFKRQKEWPVFDGNKPNDEKTLINLRRIGRQGGLSDADLDLCLYDQDFLRGLVEDYQAHVKEDGVTSTPTFFINGEKFEESRTIENFAAAIEPHL